MIRGAGVCVPGGGRAWDSGGASGMYGQGLTVKAGGQGTCGAHVKHEAHACDAGRVEAQRLVEHQRGLPSRKEGIRGGARCGPGGGRDAGQRWRKWHAR